MDETQTLRLAREAIRQGNPSTAQGMLLEVVRANPRNETAWLWLSAIVRDPSRERDCLERVLKINPNNELARQHLTRLGPLETPLVRSAPAPSQVSTPPSQPARVSEKIKKRRPIRSCLLVLAAFLIISCIAGVLTGLFPGSLPGTDSPATSTPSAKEKIIVEPGRLYDVIEDLGGYPADKEIVVRKLDGTIDERPNDLEELARSWLFCQKMMFQAATQGDFKKRDKYIAEQQQINRWLDEYHEDDWSTMLSLFDDEYW